MKRSAPLRRVTPLRATKQGLHAKRRRPRTIKPLRSVNLAHMARVKALGCIVCRHQDKGWRPAEAHHLRTRPDGQNYGRGVKAPDEETIPLCPSHHNDGPESFHKDTKGWQRKYGYERDLLAETLQLLNDAPSDQVDGFPSSA